MEPGNVRNAVPDPDAQRMWRTGLDGDSSVHAHVAGLTHMILGDLQAIEGVQGQCAQARDAEPDMYGYPRTLAGEVVPGAADPLQLATNERFRLDTHTLTLPEG